MKAKERRPGAPAESDAEPEPEEERPKAPNGTDPAKLDKSDQALDEELSESLSDELVESFIGPEEPRRPGERLEVKWLRLAWRLVLPPSSLLSFRIGFWAARAAGLIVGLSWLFYGLELGVWDRAKIFATLVILLIGPLVLKLIEFVLVRLLLRGSSRSSWRDFWSFRRMMTPRSIQSAFLVGFWLLVATGLIQVVSGFADLLRSRTIETGSASTMISEVAREITDATGHLPHLGLGPSSPALNGALKPVAPGAPATSPSLETQAEAEDSSATLDAMMAEYSDRIYETVVSSIFKRLPGIYPEEPAKQKKTTTWYAKMLRGLLMMVVGPLALRFACESIILFFRMNETLTDIARQMEIANRRRREEDEAIEKGNGR